MEYNLLTNARAALKEIWNGLIMAYGLEMCDQICNNIHDPGSVQYPKVNRPWLLLTAELHSPLLYVDT